jgi:hypothetical protein
VMGDRGARQRRAPGWRRQPDRASGRLPRLAGPLSDGAPRRAPTAWPRSAAVTGAHGPSGSLVQHPAPGPRFVHGSLAPRHRYGRMQRKGADCTTATALDGSPTDDAGTPTTMQLAMRTTI